MFTWYHSSLFYLRICQNAFLVEFCLIQCTAMYVWFRCASLLYSTPCYFTGISLLSQLCLFIIRPKKHLNDKWDEMVAQTFWGSSATVTEVVPRANKVLLSNHLHHWEHTPCCSSVTALKPTKMSTQNDGKVLILYPNSSKKLWIFFMSVISPVAGEP